MTEPDEAGRRSSRAALLLLAGASLGAVLAASAMFESIALPANESNLAEVNGWEITHADFQRAVEALQRDKSQPLTAEQRSDLLDRLIEEKLLLQRGLEMGLAETEPNVRKSIVTAMIQTITADVSAIEPDEPDLRAFYTSNQEYFAKPARLRVRQLLFRADSREAALKLADNTVADLRTARIDLAAAQQLASQQVVQVPDALLPMHKLRDYIGPELTELAASMATGSVSDPQRSEPGYIVLVVLENQAGVALELETIRERVINEYQRRAADQALRGYLEMLRAEADLSIAPDELEPSTDSPP